MDSPSEEDDSAISGMVVRLVANPTPSNSGTCSDMCRISRRVSRSNRSPSRGSDAHDSDGQPFEPLPDFHESIHFRVALGKEFDHVIVVRGLNREGQKNGGDQTNQSDGGHRIADRRKPQGQCESSQKRCPIESRGLSSSYSPVFPRVYSP